LAAELFAVARAGVLALPDAGALGFAGLELNATQCGFGLDRHVAIPRVCAVESVYRPNPCWIGRDQSVAALLILVF